MTHLYIALIPGDDIIQNISVAQVECWLKDIKIFMRYNMLNWSQKRLNLHVTSKHNSHIPCQLTWNGLQKRVLGVLMLYIMKMEQHNVSQAILSWIRWLTSDSIRPVTSAALLTEGLLTSEFDCCNRYYVVYPTSWPRTYNVSRI